MSFESIYTQQEVQALLDQIFAAYVNAGTLQRQILVQQLTDALNKVGP